MVGGAGRQGRPPPTSHSPPHLTASGKHGNITLGYVTINMHGKLSLLLTLKCHFNVLLLLLNTSHIHTIKITCKNSLSAYCCPHHNTFTA